MIEAIKKALALSVEKVDTAFESALLLIWLRNELNGYQDKPFIAFRNNLAHGFELLESDVRDQFNVRLKEELDFSDDNILKQFLSGMKEKGGKKKASQKSTGHLSLVQKQQCLRSIWTMIAKEPINHYELLFHIVVYFEATACNAIKDLRHQIVHPTFSQTLEHTLSILYQSAKAIDWDELMLAEIGEAAEKAYLEYAASVTNVIDILAKKQARLPNFVESLPTMDAVTPWDDLPVKEKVALCGKDYTKALKRCELTLKMADGRIEQNIIAAMKERVFEASELDAFSEVNWLAHMHEMKRENVLLAFLNTEKILLNKAQIKTLLLLISDQQIDFSEGSQFNKLLEKLSMVFRKKEHKDLFLQMYTKNIVNAHTLEEGASSDSYEFIVDLFERPSGVYVTLAVADKWPSKIKYLQVFGSMFEYFVYAHDAIDIDTLVPKISAFIEEDSFFVLNKLLVGVIGSRQARELKNSIVVDLGKMQTLIDKGASFSVISKKESSHYPNVLLRLQNQYLASSCLYEEESNMYVSFLAYIRAEHMPEYLSTREVGQIDIPMAYCQFPDGEKKKTFIMPAHLGMLLEKISRKSKKEKSFLNDLYVIPMVTYLMNAKLFGKYLNIKTALSSIYKTWDRYKEGKEIVSDKIAVIDALAPQYAFPEIIRLFGTLEKVSGYDMDLPAFYEQMNQEEQEVLSVPGLKKHLWLLQIVRLHTAELHTVIKKCSQRVFGVEKLFNWLRGVLGIGRYELSILLGVNITFDHMCNIYFHVIETSLDKCSVAAPASLFDQIKREDSSIITIRGVSARREEPSVVFRGNKIISESEIPQEPGIKIKQWVASVAEMGDTAKWVADPEKLSNFFYDYYNYQKPGFFDDVVSGREFMALARVVRRMQRREERSKKLEGKEL